MSSLNGGQASQLSDALRDAFEPDALDELLFFALDVRREDITMAANYRTQVFHIIRSADAAGWIFELIVAAREARPKSAGLQTVAAELGLSAANSSLERIISESVPLVDISTWRAQLGILENQVCQVEIPSRTGKVQGTGFLVAVDLCLTNYHVIAPLVMKKSHPEHVRLRFDYRRTADGMVVNEGTLFSLADDWLVASRPPSAVDAESGPGGGLPAADELDFALLRVRGAPGESPVGRAHQVEGAPLRGWLNLVGADESVSGTPLFLLQHPAGAPLKLGFGQSRGLNANQTRLRHNINSEPGSSGSPCLNARLELVGVHHAGDPNFSPGYRPVYNAAIPMKAILDYLKKSATGVEILTPSG